MQLYSVVTFMYELIIYSQLISCMQPYNGHLEDLDLLKTQSETVLQNCAAHCR